MSAIRFRYMPVDAAVAPAPIIVAGVTYYAAPGGANASGTVDVPTSPTQTPSMGGGWIAIASTGNTVDRPGLGQGSDLGCSFWDQQISKMVVWTGAHWRDATGAIA